MDYINIKQQACGHSIYAKLIIHGHLFSLWFFPIVGFVMSVTITHVYN